MDFNSSSDSTTEIATTESCKASAPRGKTQQQPEYTGYPPSEHFEKTFNSLEYIRSLGARQLLPMRSLSLSLHIPHSLTQGNKTQSQKHADVQQYINSLVSEINLIDAYLGRDRGLSQMHWSGCSLSCLSLIEIEILLSRLQGRFDFLPDCDLSIDVDTHSADRRKIQHLAALGFRQISLTTPDLNTARWPATPPAQTHEQTGNILQVARQAGFKTTKLDLIYGLPGQNIHSAVPAIASVVNMRPDRITLCNYQYLPAHFKNQRLTTDKALPTAEEQLLIFSLANERIEDAGYECLGQGHFALPDHELAEAFRFGQIYRNSQGYSTLPDHDSIALGTSGISRMGNCYVQNISDLKAYQDRLQQRELPICSGIKLNRDDVLRRTVIMAIICQGFICKSSFEVAFLIEFNNYFANELKALERLQQKGMVGLEESTIEVTPRGRRKALGLIAGAFDRYRQETGAQLKPPVSVL